MTLQEFQEHTNVLMSRYGLVEGFGLGRTWMIVSICGDWMAEAPQQRYQGTHNRLKARWPQDVHEVHALQVLPTFTRFLCLRVNSEAMKAYLSRSIQL